MKSLEETESLLHTLVFPIVISTPFAVGEVYSYLIKDEKTILVDCGHQSEEAYQQLTKALSNQGLAVEDVDEIWLTHGHPDHSGQAARLAQKSGATIKGHRLERANFAGNSDRDLFRQFFKQHGIDASLREEMLNQLDWLQQYQVPVEPSWIGEDSELHAGRYTWKVKHAPGHAPGHVVFYNERGLLFGGDILLEHISTNALINFNPETGARNRSLLQYRRSLEWMKKQEGTVLPGHGKQIVNISEIAGHHLREQVQRYQKIKTLLADQPRSLMELSRILFPDALQSGAHFLVFSKVIGYLDWGIEEGIINEEQRQDRIIYSAG